MSEVNLSNATEDLLRGFSIDKEALADAVLQGEFQEMIRILWDAVLERVGQPFVLVRQHLIVFLLIGIAASMLKQMEHLLENAQMKKTGFWIVYLMLVKETMSLFYNAHDIVRGALEAIIQFGKVFVPTFSAALTLASGRLTGAGYIAILSFVIYIVDEFLMFIVLPIIEGYMLLCILGGLWQKERIEHILGLLEKGIKLVFKGTFGIVTSIGLLQSMILPFVDQTKVGAAKKLIGLIPGVGNVSNTTLEMISGSAVLLKNGIGVIGMLLLMVICLAPIIKIGVSCLIMKVTSVVYGLLGEKELTWCMDKLSGAQVILLKTVGTAFLLFAVWILLAVYTTNQRLWS